MTLLDSHADVHGVAKGEDEARVELQDAGETAFIIKKAK